MTVFEAILLAVVEGITEFLPVSSTGHMIITSSVMGIAEDPFTKTYTVAIQFGAILSVVSLYYKRFLQSIGFYKKLIVAFLPAMVLGFMLDDLIDSMLSNVLVVAGSLVVGGIILLFIDKLIRRFEKADPETITIPTAFRIGMFQCLAMVPGVSRSAATIIGGLASGLNRKTAAEFSFFLAVPTMCAATFYKIFSFAREGVGTKNISQDMSTLEMLNVVNENLNVIKSAMTPDQVNLLIIGNIVAFLVAMLAVRSFIGFLTRHGFRVFGYYRIALGMLIIILVLSGIPLELPD